METDKLKQFLVLVPHRDTRLLLRNYSAILLKAGFTGAYCFPWAAPLAQLSRPLNPQELKNIAHVFRKSAINGKFNTKEAKTIQFPPEEKNSLLFGPCLDFTIPPDLLISDTCIPFSTAVIGACLLSDGKNSDALPRPPKFSFSAAAVANMFWQPVSLSAQDAQKYAFGFKWKIGKLFWLPKKQAPVLSPNQKCAKPGHICHQKDNDQPDKKERRYIPANINKRFFKPE
jgi:hypothetical protein